MKKIVLMALLAAAGCSKKGPDCSAAIDKGVDGYVATMKKLVANRPGLDIPKIAARLKATMVQRCTEDRWQPEVVACIGSVTGHELKGCDAKLPSDQRTKLETQLRSAMMEAIGAGSPHMPPGLEGHPQVLGGNANGSAAPSGDSAGAPAPAAPAAPSPSGTPAAPPAPSSGGW